MRHQSNAGHNAQTHLCSWEQFSIASLPIGFLGGRRKPENLWIFAHTVIWAQYWSRDPGIAGWQCYLLYHYTTWTNSFVILTCVPLHISWVQGVQSWSQVTDVWNFAFSPHDFHPSIPAFEKHSSRFWEKCTQATGRTVPDTVYLWRK